MLTTAEKHSLALTLSFLLVGGGLKLWRQSEVNLGPFQDQASSMDASGKEPVSYGRPDDTLHRDSDAEPRPESAPEGSLQETPGGGFGGSTLPGAEDPQDGRLDDPRSTGPEGTPKAGPASSTAAGEMVEPAGSSSAGRKRSGGRKAAPAGKVALDRATTADLVRVPGIGPKTAQAIVDYRAAHGPFRDLRDLLNVKGIGEKKLERIRTGLVLSPEGRSE